MELNRISSDFVDSLQRDQTVQNKLSDHLLHYTVQPELSNQKIPDIDESFDMTDEYYSFHFFFFCLSVYQTSKF